MPERPDDAARTTPYAPPLTTFRPRRTAGLTPLEALRESEARFHATFDVAPVGMAHVSLTGEWLAVNRRLASMLGYSRDELLGLRFQDLTHPDDLTADLAAAQRLLSRAIESHTVEKRYRRRDGSYVWAQGTSSVLRERRTGTPLLFVAVIEDISARRAMEEALRHRDAELRAVLDHSPDIIARFDRALRHTYVNPAVTRATGLAPDAFLGRTNRELGMPRELAEAWERGIDGVFATGEPWETHFAFPAPDGTMRRYWGRVVPERDAAGHVVSVLSATRDVTTRESAEGA